MGFFKSIKEKVSQKGDSDGSQNQHDGSSNDQKYNYQDQSQAPEITYDSYTTKSEKRRLFGSSHDTPSNTQPSDSYAPPSYPPPVQSTTEANPPPYESWLSVPDNSQLPPPPALSNEYSPSNNATFKSAELGHKWCAQNPIYFPSIPRNPSILQTSQVGELGIDPPPPTFKGTIRQLDPRTWHIKTDKKQQDTILTSTLPIYFAASSNPLVTESPSSVKFSYTVVISSVHSDAGVAVGFACKPYPPFRLPGWHRGSLAVHSDDGNRYMNDPYGGVDFTRPFQAGDELRISMSVQPALSPVQEYHGKIRDVRRVGSLPKCITRVQVERNGRVKGAWDVHEERDGEKDEGIEGLQGEADLYCAIGVFGMADFQVRFEAN